MAQSPLLQCFQWLEGNAPPVPPGQPTLLVTSEDFGMLARGYANAVRAGTYTDCEAMAYYAGAVAQYGMPGTFFQAFKVFYPAAYGGVFSDGVVLQSDGRPSGYLPGYRDASPIAPNPNEDQGHHFAFFLGIGRNLANLPPQIGIANLVVAAVGLEIYTGTPSNVGDIRLGIAAGMLGMQLQREAQNNPSGSVSTAVSNTILNGFCQPRR